MTNTHRKITTNRTTARIAAIGAFGLGTAIAFPGLAAAQDAADGSLETASAALPSESAIDTGVEADLGSLTFNLDLGAGATAPGSVSFGSLGVSPNTGSDIVDNGSGNGSGSLPGSSDDADDENGNGGDNGDDADGNGSLDLGSLGGGSGSLPGSSDDADDENGNGGDNGNGDDANGSLQFGSLTEILAGLNAGSGDEAEAATEA